MEEDREWIAVPITDADPLYWDDYDEKEELNLDEIAAEHARLKAAYPGVEIYLECKAAGYESHYLEIYFKGRRLETDEEVAARIEDDKKRYEDGKKRQEQLEREQLASLQKKYGNV